jgi:hypothetical protein
MNPEDVVTMLWCMWYCFWGAVIMLCGLILMFITYTRLINEREESD